MAEHLTDLRQGCAIAQQPRSQRVTQHVRATMSRTQVKMNQHHSNEIADTLRTSEALERGLALNEHAARRTSGARLLQVFCQSLTDVLQQREPVHAGTLASNEQFASPPVDVIQSQLSNFARAKAQSSQQKENGIIPFADLPPSVARSQHSLNLARFQIVRQFGQASVGH